jgi:AraC-like DNA-binding protein
MGDFVPTSLKPRGTGHRRVPLPLGSSASAGGSYGLAALFDEFEGQGVATRDLLASTGIPASWRHKPDVALSHAQRTALFASAQHLPRRPDTALRAGQRQKISDFGVYGYAMATSPTFGDAFRFGRDHLPLAGPVLRITFERRGNTGVLISNNPQSLGTLLPFVAEFWRSSMTTLLSLVLGAPFPSRAMYFPYEAPRYASAYRRVFACPIHFGSSVMEWHFDAAVFGVPCPNANAMTAGLCREFCERVVASGEGQSALQREVRAVCLDTQGRQASAASVAAGLGLSLRTFHRRLKAENVSFQRLLDEVRCSIAVEYLTNTKMPVEEIGHRVGFPDPSNFRKAFGRWTGRSPRSYRDATAIGQQ